jgi:hypothetical protein
MPSVWRDVARRRAPPQVGYTPAPFKGYGVQVAKFLRHRYGIAGLRAQQHRSGFGDQVTRSFDLVR